MHAVGSAWQSSILAVRVVSSMSDVAEKPRRCPALPLAKGALAWLRGLIAEVAREL